VNEEWPGTSRKWVDETVSKALSGGAGTVHGTWVFSPSDGWDGTRLMGEEFLNLVGRVRIIPAILCSTLIVHPFHPFHPFS
jgi:hypothetical protein